MDPEFQLESGSLCHSVQNFVYTFKIRLSFCNLSLSLCKSPLISSLARLISHRHRLPHDLILSPLPVYLSLLLFLYTTALFFPFLFLFPPPYTSCHTIVRNKKRLYIFFYLIHTHTDTQTDRHDGVCR